MGLKQWGPMQIICISGGCTLIIPCGFARFPSPQITLVHVSYLREAHNVVRVLVFRRMAIANISSFTAIFAILEWYPQNTFPEAGSLAITVVAIFLPLSSVWASMNTANNHPWDGGVRMKEPNLRFGSHNNIATKGQEGQNTAGMATMDSERGLIASVTERKGSCCSATESHSTTIAVEYAHSDTQDLEAQNHSGTFFGISKFGPKGHKTLVRKGGDADLDKDDIELQDGVHIHTVFEVQRNGPAPGTAVGEECRRNNAWQQAKMRKAQN